MKKRTNFSDLSYDELVKIDQSTLSDRELCEYDIELFKYVIKHLENINSGIDDINEKIENIDIKM